MRKPHSRGFTLIELMVVTGIIGILMMVVLPSYKSYVLKAKRSVGRAELLKVLARQEQFYILNKYYAPRLDLLGYLENPYVIDSGGDNVSAFSRHGVYSISLSNAFPINSPQEFIVQATPQQGQIADVQCGVLEISSVGIKSASRGSVADCW